MTQAGFSKSSEADQQLMPPERKPWPLWPWLLLAAAFVIALAVWTGLVKPESEPRGTLDSAVGTQLSLFHLEPLTGDSRTVTEADLENKITLVNFWGPWCGACAIEFPHLVELEEHFRSQPNFQFFSVSSNFDPRDEEGLVEGTEQFLLHHQATFATYRDPQGQSVIGLAKSAQVQNFGYPATVLLGPGGIIRGLWIGYVPGDETSVRHAIEKALASLPKKP